MKMMKYMTCLATALLALVACSDADDILSAYHSDPNAVHITAEVGKASADGFTRSNPLGDAEAQKKFNTDDEISVKADGQAAVTYKFNGTEWIPQDSKFLKWESETMNFTAYYPATYTGGTPTQPMEYNSEANLAAADYMSFSDSQKNTGDNKFTLTMERQMARVVVDIADFNDQYASGTKVNSVTIMGVKAYKHETDGKFYALMVPCNADNNAKFLSLKVGDNNTETLTGIPTLEAGKSYTYDLTVGKNKVVVTGITVKDWTTDKIINGVAELDTRPYLTFKAEGEQTFKMVNNGYFPSNIEYSVNDGEWNDVVADEEVTFGGSNGTLCLRGTNLSGTAKDDNYFSTISFTNSGVKVACTGDIRTLLDYRNYKTVDTQNAKFCNLFENCTALTFAPKLPAETLASNCYSEMFSGCTNLNTAPELPATTLAEACYSEMFSGCTNLNTAPSLPATKLVENCYYNMFSGCTNLNTAPKLPATKLAYWCYYGMFNDCSSLTEAPILPAETFANGCYFYMFSGCKNLKTAPSLPATRLARYCYHSMFRGCTNLTSVTMLAPRDQITSKERCCDDWLNNAGTSAASRTLKVKDEAAYNALVDKSYLPNNWKKDAEGTTVLGENSNKIE